MIESLTCSKCHKVKAIADFSVRSEYTRGYDYYCRQCRRYINRARRNEGSEAAKTTNRHQEPLSMANRLLTVKFSDIGKVLSEGKE
ncbi:MAG: hypothetical protein IBX50_04060 [Marinospirillum sp.]|nr:hypothetical protein [Marinospirillum sp.]